MKEVKQFFENPSVTEIVINNYDQIWTERNGVLKKEITPWNHPIEFQKFLREVLDLLNCDLSLQDPFCSGRVENFRIQIVAPPASTSPIIAIRRIQPKALSLESWVESGAVSRATAETLRTIIRGKRTILVYGATGSGKTTLLSTLVSLVEAYERVIVLEDIEELALPNGASTRMLSRIDTHGVLKNISLSDLVRHSLRLRPDRLALGEVRGPEAKDLLLALATGHQGSLGTIHAHSYTEALLRLEMLVQLGAPQWQTRAIRQLIQASIHVLVGMKKDENGARRICGIHRITGLEDFGFLTESL